jgi:hypothetical protein
MLKGEGFGPHSEKHGHRLGKQIASGLPGLARRFVEVAGADRGGAAQPPVLARAATRAPPGANDNRARGKRGPAPAAGPRPWEVEGISRASWFRRKKGGVG